MSIGWVHPSLAQPLCHLRHIRVHCSVHKYNILAVRTHHVLQFCNQPIQHPFNPLRLRLRVGILDPNRPMRRLDLDLITLPLVFPQQAEIADKIPPRGADFTKLGRVLDERVTEGDAAVLRGD